VVGDDPAEIGKCDEDGQEKRRADFPKPRLTESPEGRIIEREREEDTGNAGDTQESVPDVKEIVARGRFGRTHELRCPL
jgi:hypothetical protein